MANWFNKLFGAKVEDPNQIASAMFLGFVLHEEKSRIQKMKAEYSSQGNYSEKDLSISLFVYAAASVGTALMSACEKNEKWLPIVGEFQSIFVGEMNKRFSVLKEDAIESFIQANENLQRLLFTDPKKQPSLAFEWAMEWLKNMNIADVNPASLFSISSAWKSHFLMVCEFCQKSKP